MTNGQVTYTDGYGYTDQRDNSHSAGMEWENTKSHDATQNSIQFKTYKLFISEIFHIMFFGPRLTEVPKIMECKSVHKSSTTVNV